MALHLHHKAFRAMNCKGTRTMWAHLAAQDSFTRWCLDECLGLDAVRSAEVATPSAHSDATASAPHERHRSIIAFPFSVTAKSANVFATMHGGMLLSLTDILTSLHIIYALQPEAVGHVTMTLDVNFLKSAPVGEQLWAFSRIDKLGGRVVFASIDFVGAKCVASAPSTQTFDAFATASRRFEDVIAQGVHSKAITKKLSVG